MANLGTKTKNVNLVIRKNIYLDMNKITEWVNVHCEKYAFIMHEKDINLEGEVEGVHYHFVLTMLKPQRLSTILTSVCDFLEITPFGVQIDKTDNLEGSIQYLIHKRDPQKTQHDKSEIISNWPQTELDTILESDVSNGSLTFERVYEVCKTSKSLLELIETIGFGRYHLYRQVILDIWKETHKEKSHDKEYIELQEMYNNLLDTSIRFYKHVMAFTTKAEQKFMKMDKWNNDIEGTFYHI